MSETVYRPWGYWKVLSYEQNHRSQEYKVKEMTINPGQSISYQKHKHRAEKWIVISGELEIYKEVQCFYYNQQNGALVKELTNESFSDHSNLIWRSCR
jgi:mannose-6-phosphate isomerase-like protein (cupin superfamily)